MNISRNFLEYTLFLVKKILTKNNHIYDNVPYRNKVRNFIFSIFLYVRRTLIPESFRFPARCSKILDHL